MSRKSRKRELHEQEKSADKRSRYYTLFLLSGLFLLTFVLFSVGSELLPITDPVESNYALTAKEMVLTGNWISPQIYGVYWYDKPIMVYWLLSLSYSILGFTDLASRVPSALCGSLSVILLVWYLRRIGKETTVSVWAGLMMAVSLEFWLGSHAIITDSILMLFTIPTLFSAYIGLTENNKRHMTVAYGAAGLACLTKGPVGLVLPGILLLLWCAWTEPKLYIKRLFPPQGIFIFFILCAPWYIGMYFLHGQDFVNQFFGLHNILRATASEHPEDNLWYYYFLLLPITTLPWTGLFLYELKKGWKEKTPFYRFLFVWCFGTVIFYSLMATKYVTYTYISIVPACIWAAEATPRISKGEQSAFLCAIIPFFLLLCAFIAVTFYGKFTSWWILCLLTAYIVGMLVLSKKAMPEKRMPLIIAGTAASLLFMTLEILPSYLQDRSSLLWADKLHQLPGNHYFFKSYPASYTYYTGEVASRLTSDSIETESRDPRWETKYAMPSLSDENMLLSDTPFYLYVTHGNKKYFDSWPMRYRFSHIEENLSGSIYRLEQ